MIALSGPRRRSLTLPNHSGTCRSRLHASCIRLMKLMYTGHSRNGNTTPPRLMMNHSGHRLLFATTASSGIEFGWPSGSALRLVLKPQ